jgi:hypothetical protein
VVDQRDLLDEPHPPSAPPPQSPAARRASPRARARATDPETSQDAAAAFYVAKLKAYQYDIFRLLSLFGPAHDEEIVRRAKLHGVKQKESGIRTRRHELVELTLLRDSGQRVILSDSHRESIVWEVNPKPSPPTNTAPNLLV